MSDAAQLYFLRKRVFQQPVSQPHFIPSHASPSCALSRTDAASIADPYDEIIKFNVKLTSPSCQYSHYLLRYRGACANKSMKSEGRSCGGKGHSIAVRSVSFTVADAPPRKGGGLIIRSEETRISRTRKHRL